MNKKILVIEDDHSLLENISTLLSEENYKVATAENGRDGLKIAADEKPDLIICDIMMPEINGFEVLEILDKEKLLRDIPFIFISAKTERADFRMGMELGADDYIFKPFRAEELLNAVAKRLNKFENIKNFIKEKKELSTKQKKFSLDDNIFLKNIERPKFVIISQIKFISAENQYSYLHLNRNEKYIIRKSMRDWENNLPEQYFIRIHRSAIVNLNYVTSVNKISNNRLELKIADFEPPLEVSKRYSEKIKDRFDWN